MNRKLFVGNLSFSTEESTLQDLFAQAGPVESVRVMRDQATGRSRGFGFVEMSTQPEAEAAIAKLDGQSFEGRPLKVNVANPKGSGGGGASAPRGTGSGSGNSFGGGERRPSRW